MENISGNTRGAFEFTSRFLTLFPQWNEKMVEAFFNGLKASQLYWKGAMKYSSDFMTPSAPAMQCFSSYEAKKLSGAPEMENFCDFMELLRFNLDIVSKGLVCDLTAMGDLQRHEMEQSSRALANTLFNREGEDVAQYSEKQLQLLELVVNVYPEAIRNIEAEYGLHPELGWCSAVAETDRFHLYQVLPFGGKTLVRDDMKPVFIIPPYVLGPNILSFLPGENRSYVHSFANQGIPTYIRIVKDIDATPAVQLMTGEDDASDARIFCEKIRSRHEKPITLNGFCQGGYISVVDLLTGELDGLVDALITCVAPMDGSRSKALVDYIQELPPRFRNLGYATKILPNGNEVVDGTVMSWVYKLKSIEREAPLATFHRDLQMFDRPTGSNPKISKTAAALNYWIIHERQDLPVGITKMSFDSYTKPVSADGTLPFKLFDRPLNFKRFREKGIKWLLCIAEKDDLIDAPAALAPLDFTEAELTVFPKGHGSIATSWSAPTSACALQTSFAFTSPLGKGNYRGPVRFHLDLDAELTAHSRFQETAKLSGPASIEYPEQPADVVEN